MQWACEHALFEIQTALVGILENLPSRLIAWSVWPLVFPLGARYRPPRDDLGAQVARALLEDREGRRRLTRDIFIPPADEPGLGLLESVLDEVVPAHSIEAKIRDAVRAGRIDRGPGDELADRAVEAGIITAEERTSLRHAHEACQEAIEVDAFPAGSLGSFRARPEDSGRARAA
jgi:acyl-CoA dehydrogenase